MSVFIAPSKEEKIKNRLDYAIDKSKLIKKSDGWYDYDGDLDFYRFKYTSLLQIPYRFHTIYGFFDCSNNWLTSLEGAPYCVMRNFICNNNQLITLEHCPVIIGETFSCAKNLLISLKNSPAMIRGSFDCSNNQLTTLEGGPKQVKENYCCSYNQLTSLKGIPRIIYDDFECHSNPLKTLKDGPHLVFNDYRCSLFSEQQIKSTCLVKGKVITHRPKWQQIIYG